MTILMLATLGASTSNADEGRYQDVGNRVESEGYSSTPWEPFESESGLVWAADTCLGFFETRNTQLLSQNPIVFDEIGGATIDAPYGTFGIHVFDWPFDEFGVFTCRLTRSDHTPYAQHDLDELARWISSTLTQSSGWIEDDGRVWNESSDPTQDTLIILQFTNTRHRATLRFNVLGQLTMFSIRAEYLGPEIHLD